MTTKLSTVIPNDLDEAIQTLTSQLTSDEKKYLVEQWRKDPWLHHGFGMRMRNTWKLWHRGTPLHDWFEIHGIDCADDMSAIIIESLIRTLNNQPIDLENQVAFYQEFWRESKKARELEEIENDPKRGGIINVFRRWCGLKPLI